MPEWLIGLLGGVAVCLIAVSVWDVVKYFRTRAGVLGNVLAENARLALAVAKLEQKVKGLELDAESVSGKVTDLGKHAKATKLYVALAPNIIKRLMEIEKFAFNQPTRTPTVDDQDAAFDDMVDISNRVEQLQAAGLDPETAVKRVLEERKLLAQVN